MSTTGTLPKKEAVPQHTPEELAIIALGERMEGRKLTEQEIHLSLEQARHIGEL